jgi:hypothetical protein
VNQDPKVLAVNVGHAAKMANPEGRENQDLKARLVMPGFPAQTVRQVQPAPLVPLVGKARTGRPVLMATRALKGRVERPVRLARRESRE